MKRWMKMRLLFNPKLKVGNPIGLLNHIEGALHELNLLNEISKERLEKLAEQYSETFP